MDKGFLIYVIYIGLLIVLLMAVFLFVNIRKRKDSSPPFKDKIEGGSISVFFDNSNNVTVIAYAKDKYGVGRAVENPQYLKAPYTTEKLGEIIRRSMALCKNGVTCNSSEIMEKLDYKDWKDFSKNRRSISIYYKRGVGVVFNTTTRRSDGAYRFNMNTYDMALAEDRGNRELGNITLELLARCRV